jgi:YVTN family beta-propeller protein
MKNTGSPKGRGLGAPVAALSVALLILVAAFVYIAFSPKQATSTSSTIAPSSSATGGGTSATSTNQISTSYSTTSTSGVSSAATSATSSSAITVFQSMPTSSAPPRQGGVFDAANGDIYWSNFDNGTVSVISNSTNKVVASVRVGAAYVEPWPPLLDPQNGDIYVPMASAGFVAVISGATNTVVANFTIGEGVFSGMAFDPSNGDIYLTNDVGQVLIISGETNTVVGSITLDFGPPACEPMSEFPSNIPCSQAQDGPSPPVFDPANGDIYVCNGGGDSMSIMSGATNSLVTNIKFSSSPGNPVFDPANGDIYVPVGGAVSVISGATNALVATVKVGGQPDQPFVNSINGDIYVASANTDFCGAGVCLVNGTVSIISGATNAVVATVPMCDDSAGAFESSNGDVYLSCHGGTDWVISYTTLPSSTTTTSTRLGEFVPDCGTPFNTLLNPAPKGTVYMKVVTDQGTVVTNGTLFVIQGGSFGWMTYCISMSDVNGTGYLQLAPVNFNGTHGGDFISSGYYNVTLWAGSMSPNVTNNPGSWYVAIIPSIQVSPNSTTYVMVSVPSDAVTVVTSNEGTGAVTTTTTSATTTKVNIP